MTEKERDEVIGFLVLWTNWNETAFVKLSDEELMKMYERHCNAK